MSDRPIIYDTEIIEPNVKYDLFLDYGKAIKHMLNKLLYIDRFPKDKNVLIQYATPRKAWSEYAKKLYNGEYNAPIASFNMIGMNIATDHIMGGFNPIYYPHPKDNDKFMYELPPSIWKLTYNLTLWSLNPIDMDRMLSQILIYTMAPKLFVTQVKGTWCQIGCEESVNIEDELEPEETRDRLIRRSLTLYIPRAYLPREAWEVYRIENINVDAYISTELGKNEDKIELIV